MKTYYATKQFVIPEQQELMRSLIDGVSHIQKTTRAMDMVGAAT